jgi:protein-disulfide isomerase
MLWKWKVFSVDDQNSTPENETQAPLFPPVSESEKPKNDPVPTEKLAMINLSQLTVNYLVIAVVFLGIGILMGRLIFGNTGSNLDIAQIRSVVAEAVAQAGSSGGAQVSANTLVDDDPSVGPENAVVTIVEFSDFNCGYCDRFARETLPQILETYGDQVRFVYRDLPIIGGQESVNSSIAAECAADQGKFWEYHNLLFANQQARGRDVYVGFATELGLDTTAFTTCLDDPQMLEEVRLDFVDGQSLDINGTPHFLVNNRRVSGAQPFEVFQAIINQELQAAGVDVAASQS